MKVLLINPRFSNTTTDIPLGLAYVAAVALKTGCDVRAIDADAKKTNLTNNDVIGITREYAPDLIGISIYTGFARRAYELMGMLSPLMVPIVVGGPHPTVVPEEAFRFGASFAVRGEGEETFRELIEYFQRQRSLDSIPGLSYRRDGEIVHNQPRPLIEDLDSIPLPAKELFNREHYVGRMGGEPFGGILTSRGCPGRCVYCSNQVHGRRFRFRQPSKVVEEIKLLQNRYGIEKFTFVDDSFTVRKDRSREICQQIIKQKLGIEWSCFTRVNFVDRELLALMKESGCTLLDYGIEHGDDDSLKALKKGITLNTIEEALTLTREVGIRYQTNYILGFPWDTVESVNQTLQHALKWSDLGFQGGPIVPYPGTELYEQYKDELNEWWLKRDEIKWQEIKQLQMGRKRLADYSFFRLDGKTERAIEKALKKMRMGNAKPLSIAWCIRWLLYLSYKISPNLEARLNVLISKGMAYFGAKLHGANARRIKGGS